ncbi:uncharacterized protein PV09_05384 [Verruconis gallopava]|uniref:Uncharacterized protein n=1 Tax=Verruconis gallopava TaxID=253628 RepID=A0A0D1YSM8_9PEZI|nr:uncharacterized protein PV09_05384 [Verruconis gallopava]KIW03632.1 hypothetical protein PV09_05384 [Verruconis gallopava]
MYSQHKEPENQPFLDNFSDEFIHSTDYRNRRLANAQRKRLISHGLVFLATSLLWLAIWLYSSSLPFGGSRPDVNIQHNITSNAKLLECGSSPREARALGCKYDILLNHWVPEPCYDEEFIQEYADDQSWAAYIDEDLTQRIYSIHEMSEKDYYFTSFRDHVNHCAVIWKKQFWVLYEERKSFDTMIASPEHTDHCALYLSEAVNTNSTEATRVTVGYAGCWIRD